MDRINQIISKEEIEQQKEYAARVRMLPHRPEKYYIVTYGCQMNAHDSEKLAGMLKEMGMTPAPGREEADFVIFNTCCVRDNAERRALGNITWLKEVRKQKPELMIAVCGCMIQEPGMAEKMLKQYRFINLAFGTANLHRFPEMMFHALDSGQNLIAVEQQDVIPEGLPLQRARKEAAYVTIMYGCDNFCSYCIVPYVRGRERSREPEAILNEAEQLLKDGTKEIMLLGQNVNSYGKGLQEGISFARLLKELDRMGIPRIRFMTSHPKDLSDELIEVMSGSSHILPQFHLPVQSGSDRILEKMNRRYTRDAYMERVRKLRAAVPGIGLSTDIIVGFPGETDDDFLDTLDLVRNVGFDSAFTFIFSPRVGTRAAAMENQIPADVAAERIEALITLQESKTQEQLKRFLGGEEEVLVEGFSKRSTKAVSGKGRHAISITMDGSANDIGKIVKCRITDIKHNTLMGERI